VRKHVRVHRFRTVAAWILVLPLAAWASVRLGGWERGHPLVALMAFTPYVAPLALLATLVCALLRRRAPAVLALVTALVLSALLVPRATGSAEGVSGVPLVVATVNLRYGDVPPAALVDLVRAERVDVLALQELTPAALEAIERSQLVDELRHVVAEPRPAAAGTALLARKPLAARPAPRGTFAQAAAALRVDGVDVRIVSVHAAPPVDGDGARRWAADLRALPDAGDNQILAGDFNATLDHAAFRELLDRGYADTAARVGAGLVPTWRGGRAPWLTLDHVLVPSRQVVVGGVEVHRVPGSDHRAVVARIML
jgi:endonuclease/exonuclease/phosphatase family metal-dependent hydrolase